MSNITFPKSGSVWYEQVDTALINLLHTNIKVKDKDDNLVPVTVLMRNPDTDIEGNYPCITISSYDEKFSVMRDGRERFVSAIDTVNSLVTLEYPSQPYDLYYQIDLWSEYQIDINTMTMQFISLIGEHYSLAVKDTLNNSRLSVMDKVNYAKVDYVEGETNKRVFHRVYSYRIQVELDERLPDIKGYVSSPPSVNVNP